MQTKTDNQTANASQNRAIAEVRPVDNKWAVTMERPGSTCRISRTFNTEDEAIDFANQFLSEYRNF